MAISKDYMAWFLQQWRTVAFVYTSGYFLDHKNMLDLVFWPLTLVWKLKLFPSFLWKLCISGCNHLNTGINGLCLQLFAFCFYSNPLFHLFIVHWKIYHWAIREIPHNATVFGSTKTIQFWWTSAKYLCWSLSWLAKTTASMHSVLLSFE